MLNNIKNQLNSQEIESWQTQRGKEPNRTTTTTTISWLHAHLLLITNSLSQTIQFLLEKQIKLKFLNKNPRSQKCQTNSKHSIAYLIKQNNLSLECNTNITYLKKTIKNKFKESSIFLYLILSKNQSSQWTQGSRRFGPV